MSLRVMPGSQGMRDGPITCCVVIVKRKSYMTEVHRMGYLPWQRDTTTATLYPFATCMTPVLTDFTLDEP